jgi:hydroxymethylpyrimidine pyrophosphatase-like HAD family hydrolase
MIIAVDFDGTIVENRYPNIGREISFAIDTLKALSKAGHQLILWTVRNGKQLEEAVAFCEERGVTFYAVNKSYPEEEFDESISRKINADLFIDDRNIGGMLSWGAIYQMICPELSGIIEQKIKKSFFQRMFE